MNILGIETSCDDTGIAIIEADAKTCQILSNVVSSQTKIHAPYGGVVPNLAARAHLENIEPCLKKALEQASQPKIDLIAVTIGPGLIPSLLVGVNFAKALAYALKKPLIGINHIEGHICANWINSKNVLPALCLIVSGGHTQLVLMKDFGKYQILGQTRDDAAGEAFDKVAKLLSLSYPGGPIISQRAEKGDAQAFNLPRPMLKEQNLDFSFSGLKTAVLYKVRENKRKLSQKYINDMCACFQQAVIDVLLAKTIRAAQKYQPKTIILGGGVAANKELRLQLKKRIKESIPDSTFQVPSLELCTDNGAMIALAGYWRRQKAKKKNWKNTKADASLKL